MIPSKFRERDIFLQHTWYFELTYDARHKKVSKIEKLVAFLLDFIWILFNIIFLSLKRSDIFLFETER